MYYFSDNYVYDNNASISVSASVSGHPSTYAIDGDKNTYWGVDDVSGWCIIDLGRSRDVDSVWIKTGNVGSVQVYYSDNGVDWTQVSGTINKTGGVFWSFGFVGMNRRYWKLVISGEAIMKIYEIFLLKLRVSQSSEINAPSKVSAEFVDAVGGVHTMADGSTVSYAGSRAYIKLTISYEYTPKANRDNLYLLFTDPYPRPVVCILPDIDYMDGMYRCVWNSTGFGIVYSESYKGAGFSGTLEFVGV